MVKRKPRPNVQLDESLSTIHHDEPFDVKTPRGGPDFHWALKIRKCVLALHKKYPDVKTISFFGCPADQWKLACRILDDASRASGRL